MLINIILTSIESERKGKELVVVFQACVVAAHPLLVEGGLFLNR